MGLRPSSRSGQRRGEAARGTSASARLGV